MKRSRLVLLICLVILAGIGRTLLHSDLIEDRDGALFVRAMDHYSTLEGRPHWPGYPVYIWLGQALTRLLGDPVRALHLLSALSSSLLALPLALLARDWARALRPEAGNDPGGAAALLTVGLWSVIPLSWLDGTEIFSDPTALLFATLMFWSSSRAALAAGNPAKDPARSGQGGASDALWASAFGGLMVGIRLSYAVLLLPMLYAAWRQRRAWTRENRRLPWLLGAAAGIFGLSVLGWLGWQWAMEGQRFLLAAERHLTGHYGSWGGTVHTDSQSWARPGRLLHTIMVFGFGGYWPGLPLWRLLPTLAGLGLAGLGLRQLARGTNPTPFRLLMAWTLPYLIWILLGHDVDLARYSFPLVISACLMAGMAVIAAGRLATSLSLLAFLGLLTVTTPLVMVHRHSPLLEHQLAEQLQRRRNAPRQALLVRESLPLVLHLEPMTMPVPLGSLSAGRRAAELAHRKFVVYATSAVLTPEDLATGDWETITRLRRDPLMRSRGATEWVLYRFHPGTGPATSPRYEIR